MTGPYYGRRRPRHSGSRPRTTQVATDDDTDQPTEADWTEYPETDDPPEDWEP